MRITTDRRRGAHFAALGALALFGVLSSCGGDGATGVGRTGPSLSLDASSGAPYEVMTARVRGAVVPASPMVGTFGGASVTALRLDDSTIAVAVPNLRPGSARLALPIGGDTASASIQVVAAAVVASPDSYVADALAAARASADSALDAARLAASPDTVAFVAVKSALAAATEKAAAGSASDRAQLAEVLSANADALGIGATATVRVAGASTAMTSSVTGACKSEDGRTLTTWEECSAELDAFLSSRVLRAKRAAGFAALAGAGAILGGPVGIFVAGVTVALAAEQVSALVSESFSRFITPVFKALVSDVGSQSGVRANVATSATASVSSLGTATFMKDTARAFPVYATYGSPTAADAATNTIVADAIGLLEGLRTAWKGVAAYLPIGPAPAIPTSAARTVTDTVPVAYLRLGATAPTKVTGAAATVDGVWTLKFTAAGLGSDLPFTFGVTYTAPGRAATTQTVSAMLRPAVYPVAAITVSPASPSVAKGQTAALTAVLIDSAGRVLSGRETSWSSSNPSVASIDAATGVVTGVAAGTSTITASAEGKQGQTTLTVGAGSSAFTAATLAVVTGQSSHTCALQASGAAFCWGRNTAGQIGNGTSDPTSTSPVLSATPVSGALSFAGITTGQFQTCARQSDGTAYCWGNNQYGQLGLGTTGSPITSPTAVATSLRFTTLATGSGHTCGLTSVGAAYCWGYNVRGQVGDGAVGDTAQRNTPTAVLGGLAFTAIATGRMHSCGLASGRAYCWGHNSYGQVGDSLTSSSDEHPRPFAVIDGGSLSAITVGGDHSCALTTSGTAVCWGDNFYGSLGDGTGADHWQVTAVSGGRSYTQISAGYYHTCAVTSAGEAYCWGYNGDGELGDGTITNRLVPVRVSGSQVWRSISAGDGVTCGLTTANQVYCWGQAKSVGDGSTSARSVPTAVIPAS